ncbi:RuBisCO accumulation factor 1 [Synechococcus sp. PCC 7336]|uniref:RuBisCO accumulation factor 1 n=1 Tax=Synechococcus sp. PCC 7336 TaxID=195250 RepID=UPI000348CA35|nr:RuBisCO accumulation factor 1 [Synechococcus sp. PCC 7336]
MPETNPAIDTEALIIKLRRKQGNWVEWGEACQHLQKAQFSPQQIFEDTGFEPIQQNQIIVAAQVFRSIEAEAAPASVLDHFGIRGSDVLYELRLLAQGDRAAAAELALKHNLEFEQTRDAVKAIKDYARLKQLPEGYDSSPGDAVAYQSWRLTRQKEDLQARSRLIARGLQFATSDAARQALEKLLTDFTTVKARPAPRLPLFRLESEDELPLIVPVVGRMPLSKADLQSAPIVEPEGAFGLVKFSGNGAWVALPGWQVLMSAADVVAILADGEELADFPSYSDKRLAGELLMAIDRDDRNWRDDGYFMVEEKQQLRIVWQETEPDLPILGRLLCVLRPKAILDENLAKDPWQIDE